METNLLSLIIFAPLAGAVVNWFVGRRLRDERFIGIVACAPLRSRRSSRSISPSIRTARCAAKNRYSITSGRGYRLAVFALTLRSRWTV
jgi:hypothetical protein